MNPVLRMIGGSEWSGVLPSADVIVVHGAAMTRETILDLLRSASARQAVIVVLPRLTEKTTAEYLRAGAIDCIRTTDCGRLSAVIDRELRRASPARTEICFRSIVENASDIIAIVDLDGRIGYHSPSAERDLGYARDELSGWYFTDFVNPLDVESADRFFLTQIANPGANERIDVRLRHASGAWRWFELVANNLLEDGVVTSTVIHARDLTERRQLASKLEHDNRLISLGRLAATVSHEFNNVLMGMQPFAELMQRSDYAPSIVAKGARHISNSIQRGKRVALDLLRFTQPATPSIAPVALDDWWERLAPEFAAMIGNSISLTYDVPSLYVMADASQLTQVIANLVSNARDAMPRGGRLTVRARRVAKGAHFSFGFLRDPEKFVHLSVEDSGVGMHPHVIERLFDPLFTTKSNGTGLGLAITHQIVARHEGHVFVESEPNRGTTFHLFLPAEEREQPVAVDVPNPNVRLKTQRVLIVDDEPAIVDGMTLVLESLGIAATAVLRGSEAEEAVRTFGPELVVLDIGLPDINGVQLGRELRSKHPRLPLVFATGHGDANQIEIPGGLTRFLHKPFDLDTLAAAIGELERERECAA